MDYDTTTLSTHHSGDSLFDTVKMANSTETFNLTNFTSPGSTRETEDTGIYPEVAAVLLIVVTAIAVLGAVENLVALAILLRHRSAVIWERGGFTISLAASDFVLVSCHVTQYIIYSLPADYIQGLDFVLFSKFMIILQWGSITTSMWSLYALVMDRYLSVQRSTDHERRIPKSRIPLICVLIWLLSFSLNSLYIIVMKPIMYIFVTIAVRIHPAIGTNIVCLLFHCFLRRKLLRHRYGRSVTQEGMTSWSTRLLDVKKSVVMFSVTSLLQLFGAVACTTAQVLQVAKCGMMCPLAPENDFMFIVQDIAVTAIFLSVALNPWIHTFRQRELLGPCCLHYRSDNRSSYSFTGHMSNPADSDSSAD